MRRICLICALLAVSLEHLNKIVKYFLLDCLHAKFGGSRQFLPNLEHRKVGDFCALEIVEECFLNDPGKVENSNFSLPIHIGV